MTSKKDPSQQTIYEDSNIKINSQSVTVLKFYFPHHNSSSILFKDINKLALKEMDPMDETLGVDSGYFDDFKTKIQQNRNMYIEMAVQDQSVRLSFAPDKPKQVYKIIEQKWQDSKIKAERQSVQPLQQKKLYQNVQLSKESIQKAIQQIKKSEIQKPEEYSQNYKKRNSTSPSKTLQLLEGQNPKKKLKQNSKVEKDQNLNPSINA